MDELEKKDLQILWTIEQVANYFHISKRTIYQWISKGTMIDPAKLVYVGSLVRIPRSEVERIANKKREKIVRVPKPKVAKVPKPVAAAPIAVAEPAKAAPVLATPIK